MHKINTMKKIIALLFVLSLVACQNSTKSNVEKFDSNITYFKDAKTGLCFAAINSRTYGGSDVTSITCVPCEALSNVDVTTINR